MKISVKVKTKAKEELVEKIGENNFSVAVKEPAEKGKANAAVAKALAGYFKIPLARARIVSGYRSRRKTFELDV